MSTERPPTVRQSQPIKFAGAALMQRSVACWIARISVGFVQSREMLDVGTEGISIMRKLMIAAALVSTAMATPAMARDGAPYVGLDVGVLRPSPLSQIGRASCRERGDECGVAGAFQIRQYIV